MKHDDDDVDRHFERFDRNFNRAQKLVGGMMIVITLAWVAVLGFLGYVAMKLLSHFGIL